VSTTAKAKSRLYAHHPTQVAGAEHRDLPLHVQDPPVAFLSWQKADAIIKAAASRNEQKLWAEVSAWYRSPEAAERLAAERDPLLDVTAEKSSALDKDDMDTLVKARFIERTTKLPARLVRLFAAVEERNGEERRRVISWPRSVNEAERARLALLKAEGCEARMPRVEEIRDRGAKAKYAATLDFKKFYQQFELLVKDFWGVQGGGESFYLRSMPTGAAGPPSIAQLLSTVLLREAINRTEGAQDIVEWDCNIDNLRMVSNDLPMLNAAWLELLKLIRELNITVGDHMAPTSAAYTYLGQHFNAGVVTVAEKAKKKYDRAIALLDEGKLLGADIAAIFGHCIWGSSVVDDPLAHHYYIFKFYRRKSVNLDYDAFYEVWPSIRERWKNWIRQLQTKEYIYRPVDPATRVVTVYTDASEDGYGIVIFGLGDTRVVGGKWTDAEKEQHINVLELATVRVALRVLRAATNEPELIIDWFIDNTTAIAVFEKGRSRTFSLNEIAKEIQQHTWARTRQIRYVKSEFNLADAPSRWFSKKHT
jgi:hypothetical protein